MKQIQAIYREEGKLKDLPSEERLLQRQAVIKPLVDALFAYLKKDQGNIAQGSTLKDAYTYILNQEKYLRVFLEDGDVPMDNNASERAIRGFTIGRGYTGAVKPPVRRTRNRECGHMETVLYAAEPPSQRDYLQDGDANP